MMIRDASESDLPRIVEIYNSTVPGRIVTADTEPVTVASRLQWFGEHDPATRPLWVAEINNEICGWLSFSSFYGRPAYNATVEISVYVAPEHRGKGIGRTLLGKAIDHSPAIGVKTLLGFIFAHNAPSLGLFKKYGFEQWAYLPDVAELDGVPRSLVIVGKKV